MTRELMLLLLGFSLIVVQGALGAVVDLGVLMPNPILPLVLYLAMTGDVTLARGAALAFLLGFLFDSATGNAMGLFTFVHEASFLVARAAGVRLIVRGRLSQMMITALASGVGSVVIIALLRIFRPASQASMTSPAHAALAVVASAIATGLISPLVIQLARRVDSLRRRDEGAPAL